MAETKLCQTCLKGIVPEGQEECRNCSQEN